MIGIGSTVRRTRKPNIGATLDWDNPLTSGLRYCFAFNEGSGGYGSVGLKNLALPLTATTQPTDGTIGSSTNVTWNSRGSLTWASSTSSYVDCGANDDTTGEITWLARMKPTSLTGLLTVFGQNKTDGSESIDSVYFESSQLSWWINRAGGQTQILNGAATLSTNTAYRFAGRRSGASGAWIYTTWINEEQDDTASSALDPTINGADGNFRLGFAGLYTGAPFVGDFEFFALWNGVALKDHDLLSLSANPWQLFTPVRQNYLDINTTGASPPPPPAPPMLLLTGVGT